MTTRRSIIAFTALAAGFVIGCGLQPNRVPVSGKVTLGGKDLSAGMVTFQRMGSNVAGASNDTIAYVKDGAYSVPAEQGIFPGKYAVTVGPMTIGSETDLKTAPPQFPVLGSVVEIYGDGKPINFDVPEATPKK